ncbi:putative spermidine/putrescine transport system substrate-binding protein [Enhydrobacter aerosaccus]|uniref:Putative spermidine/putrescine transport system substrate-binding protein n=2 Tax=Enhydrobacter aerosaccus TaxID=225324 RepID=A0A1T4T0V1_9HYPH|nr:putative spermidine/putrescine transport system substrate-binding protein [Enhydrobacter aerosaccus]
MGLIMISRRKALRAGAGLAAAATIGAPAILHAETKTLKITTWGGKWGDIMKDTLLPMFEKEHDCKVSADQAFPFLPKLQASSKNDPLYDVFHTNSNEQWSAVEQGLVLDKITAKEVPNIADVYPWANSDKIVGVAIFTSAIGLGYRTDKGITPPKSWKDLADPKLAGARGGYLIPVNSLGQCHLMMLGKVYGKGLQDLDAAYKALEQLKPIKLVDFTGQMEKMLLSGEVSEGVIHDSGVYRYEGANRQPVDFCSPTEGVMALEQVLNVTPGSKVKELAFAFVNFMLRPEVQKLLAEGVWYSPANKKVKLDAKYDAKLLTTPEKVATLIQPDWKWYNARKDDIDARVTKILKG